MSRAANLVTGLVLIVAGAGGIAYLNLELVPSLSIATEPPKATDSAPVRGERVVATSTPAAATVTASVTASVTATSTAQASASATPAPPNGPVPPVKFETGAATARNLVQLVEPVAKWMKSNPTERVVLVGHGDSGQRGREYQDLGRARGLAVRRALLDWTVAVSRIGLGAPEVSADLASVNNASAGTVEVRVTPKGER